jgi:pimeloyl-ACP methyl ester carboxylesterase
LFDFDLKQGFARCNSWYVMRMAVASRRPAAAPAGIDALVERYDPDAIDVPGGRALVRLRVRGGEDWDVRITGRRARLIAARQASEPDAVLAADPATWMRVAGDVRAGMQAFQRGALRMRGSLHLGVGFLAATSGADDPGRLTFERLRTRGARVSVLSAGLGPDVVLCLHGLGGTKASFLPTVAALAERYRVVAMDLPGFGESDKPIGAPYDSEWFARAAFDTLDALGVDAAHLAGNSMGGRVAIEAGLMDRSRVRSLVLLSPALAWLRDRRWAPVVRLLRPELGLLQVAPRSVTDRIVRRLVPGGNDGWAAAGVDEFLRSYLTPRGRAAFYAAARSIYLDEPHGDDGFWNRLGGLATDALFVWGRHDTLVPIAFMKHVERALPAARHVELDCGHVPQLERPRETHAAMLDFMRGR